MSTHSVGTLESASIRRCILVNGYPQQESSPFLLPEGLPRPGRLHPNVTIVLRMLHCEMTSHPGSRFSRRKRKRSLTRPGAALVLPAPVAAEGEETGYSGVRVAPSVGTLAV